jgi:hypothetical protein
MGCEADAGIDGKCEKSRGRHQERKERQKRQESHDVCILPLWRQTRRQGGDCDWLCIPHSKSSRETSLRLFVKTSIGISKTYPLSRPLKPATSSIPSGWTAGFSSSNTSTILAHTCRGPRPSRDINRCLFVEYENERVVFRNKRKYCTISEELWKFLRDTYDSRFALLRKSDGSCQAYKASCISAQVTTYVEIELCGEEELNNSVEEYLPTIPDAALPLREDKDKEKRRRRNSVGARTEQLDRRDPLRTVTVRVLDKGESDGGKVDLGVIQEEGLRVSSCSDQHPWTGLEDLVARPAGLKNYGENCYVNACLQCLLCVPEMNAYFLKESYREMPWAGPQEFRICGTLSTLYQRMCGRDEPAWVAPRTLLTLLPSGQQDAHEFIWKKLFPSIRDETNPPSVHPRGERLDGKRSWRWYKANHKSIVDVLFSGQYESQVACQTCGKVSATYDPFLDISLPAKPGTLLRCLDLHFEDELLSQNDAYQCNYCHSITAATKRLRIDISPKYLILHLKRLVRGHRKISGHIEYGLHLDMTQYL